MANISWARQELEDHWREKVRSALRRHREAKETATDSVLMERSELLTPEPDGSFAYRKALQAENIAL